MPDIPNRLTAALADRYTLERELGQGGMATVYLAQDLKHQRRVAIKVLKPDLAAVLGAERFVQEITTTAALQHPHILPLFDSGTAEGFLYYVMPFIDGETLRTRLDRETQLGIEEAVGITTAVADALDYAHRQGVIHRDIKPENILLHDGRPMVADFGIALAVSAAAGGRMTETGLSLGTPHYMSPEQATAEKEITARSDIYSLGSVCYEMLTGEPPHMGTSAQAIIMKIVTEDAAPVTRLRKNVPTHVAAAVGKAIEKLPADRFATAREFAEALTNPAFRTAAIGGGAGTDRPSAQPPVRLTAALAALALLATAVAAWGWLRPAGPAADTPVVRAELDLGDSLQLAPIPSTRLDVSPDGRLVVFVGGTEGEIPSLWLRDVASGTVRQLLETRNAIAPFFSPDGQSVGFFSGSQSGRSDLQVIGIRDGVVQTVVKDSVSTYGAAWGDDGNIYFSHASLGLARVPARGGAVTIVARPDSASNIRELDFPAVLPGSKFAVVMLWRGSIGSSTIGIVNLETGAVRDLLPGSFARYLDPGRLILGTADGTLQVVGLDPDRGELLGSPARVMGGVQREAANGTVQFAVSRTGTLVYQGGQGSQLGLAWVDRTGAITPVDSAMPGLGFNGVFASLARSPGGRAVAVTQSAGTEDEIWIKQLPAGAFSRLAFDAGANRPAWSPDGREVAFLSSRDGTRSAWVRRADGSDTPRLLVPSRPALDEVLFHPDGRQHILRSEGTGPGTRKLLAWTRGTDSVPRLLVDSPFDHYAVTLSPDGRWIAYVSEESGDPEVYVRPYPAADSARYPVSIGGGVEPLWSPTGRELFYRDRRGAMRAVPVETSPAFRAGTPEPLFFSPELSLAPYYRGYDVSPDGQRFLMLSTGDAGTSSLKLVLNWRRELDERASQATGR